MTAAAYLELHPLSNGWLIWYIKQKPAPEIGTGHAGPILTFPRRWEGIVSAPQLRPPLAASGGRAVWGATGSGTAAVAAETRAGTLASVAAKAGWLT